MNIFLWVLQFLLGILFLSIGIEHFALPPGLPERVAWMYDLSPVMHLFSGVAEILAALGLILPGLTRIQTRLTPLAALGIVLLMAGASAWHITRGEFANVFINILIALLAGIVAYGRWKLAPFKEKGAS